MNKSHIYLFNNPSARTGCNTRSVFKRSLTGLISKFFFSEISCQSKTKEPGLRYFSPIAGERVIGFILFPRILIYVKCNQPRPGLELVSTCPFFTTVTITPPKISCTAVTLGRWAQKSSVIYHFILSLSIR